MSDNKTSFIEFMLDCGVLRFGDFTTKSGRKSPYFVNTGLYRTGSQISRLGEYYARCVRDSVEGDISALFGPAYKGIPLAVTTSAALYSLYGLDCGYTFNRKEAKDHGEGGVLVGCPLKDGDRVVIIEDVMTAGTAVRETLPILKAAADVVVRDIVISVDRREVGVNGKSAVREIKEDFGITVHSIVNVDDIYAYLKSHSADADQLSRMEDYMGRYCER
ncbi:MAG: orotate phosphoribosyltransferase [Eubacteriales bacterium]